LWWVANPFALPRHRAAQLAEIDHILGEAHGFVKALLCSDAPNRGIPPDLALSMIVLGETLAHAKNGVFIWGTGYSNADMWSGAQRVPV
jgi:hypothetical protein